MAFSIHKVEQSFSTSSFSLELRLKPSWFCVDWEIGGDKIYFLVPNVRPTWLCHWWALSCPRVPRYTRILVPWLRVFLRSWRSQPRAFPPETPVYHSSQDSWSLHQAPENVTSLSLFPGAAVQQKAPAQYIFVFLQRTTWGGPGQACLQHLGPATVVRATETPYDGLALIVFRTLALLTILIIQIYLRMKLLETQLVN